MSLTGRLGQPDDPDDDNTGGWRVLIASIGVIASLMFAAACAWSLAVQRTAAPSVVEVVEVAPSIAPGSRLSQSLRVTWVDADGRRDSYPVPAGTEIRVGDQLTVTRSDLVDEIVSLEWKSGRLDVALMTERTAVAGLIAALIVGSASAVAVLRRRR